MKTVIYILFAIVGVAAALWLSRTLIANRGDVCKRFGLYEGRELVAVVDGDGDTCHVVEDSRGHKVFDVPVRNCILDVRYRDGLLRFREKVTGRLGYIDKNGVVTFILEGRETGYEQENMAAPRFIHSKWRQLTARIIVQHGMHTRNSLHENWETTICAS